MRSQALHELVLSASARWGKRPALRHVYGGKVREVAYADLPRLTYLFAQALAVRGVVAGDRVILCADNCPEWVIACLAAFRLGITVVPVDSRCRQADIELFAEKVKPSLYILGRMQFGMLRDSLDDSRVALLDEFLAPLAEIAERPNLVLKSISPDTAALIVFTSGTSGVSKGVVLSHGNVAANVGAITERFRVDNTDRLLSILPLSHMFEFTAGLIGPLIKGGCMVYSRLRGPEHLKELLQVERINVLIGVPAIYQNILKGIELKVSKLSESQQSQLNIARKLVSTQLSTSLNNVVMQKIHHEVGGTIKFWAAGGAPVPAEVVRDLASFGIPVLAGYGLTEASPIIAANTHNANRPGSVGLPLRNVEVRICPLDGSVGTMPVGEDGQIIARARSVMKGYYGDDAATAEVVRNGWLYTGDVGHLDKDGYLYVTGRIKSTIVTGGGYNIHPEELERALEQSALIKESCVFGVGTAGGEQAHAIIVPAADCADRANDKEFFRAEIARCFADLAEYKRLSGFEVYQGELPRTRTNKIQRAKAAEVYEQLRADASTIAAVEAPKFDDDGIIVRDILISIMEQAAPAHRDPNVIGLRSSLSGDLAIDSFARLELAVRLEEEFSIAVPEEALNDVQTVEELITLLKSRRNRGADDAHEILNSESANFDKLMATYSSFAPPGSAQAKRLAESVEPWPFGRPIVPDLHIRENALVMMARRSMVASMKIVLSAVNQFECKGAEKLNLVPPYILVANHSSHVDTAALVACFPPEMLRRVHPVAASDTFFNNKISAEISSNLLNAVSFDRYGDFEQSMKECLEFLARGEILVMFPEGTRSLTGRPGRFRSGVSQLAITAGCPVIPAYIDGAANVLPKKARMLKTGKLRVLFGDPLMPPPTTADLQQIQEFTRKLEEAVLNLSDS